MSLQTRLAKLEAVEAERREAEAREKWAAFAAFRDAHWTPTEQEAFRRVVLNDFRRATDADLAAMGKTRAEVDDLLAAYPAPTAADMVLADAAWGREPELAELIGREDVTAAEVRRAVAAASERVEVRGFNIGDAGAPALGVRQVDYRAGLAQLAPADLGEVASAPMVRLPMAEPELAPVVAVEVAASAVRVQHTPAPVAPAVLAAAAVMAGSLEGLPSYRANLNEMLPVMGGRPQMAGLEPAPVAPIEERRRRALERILSDASW
jgi:hypothetical protein